MSAGSFTKDPVEEFPVFIEMRRALPPGRTIARVVGSALDLADDSAAGSVIRQPGSATGTLTQLTVRAGALNHRYQIILDIYDNVNSRYRQSLVMVIREA